MSQPFHSQTTHTRNLEGGEVVDLAYGRTEGAQAGHMDMEEQTTEVTMLSRGYGRGGTGNTGSHGSNYGSQQQHSYGGSYGETNDYASYEGPKLYK